MQLSFDWDRIDQRDLTGLMAEVAEACGVPAVLFLCERFGGMTLAVTKLPRKLRSVDELRWDDLAPWMREVADRHSMKLARTLVDLRGGEMIYVPVLTKLEEAVKGRQIRELYDGRNAGELAAQFNMPRRKVLSLARQKG